ncbi:hypothetical protein D3C87_1721200 [compost metagenome]
MRQFGQPLVHLQKDFYRLIIDAIAPRRNRHENNARNRTVLNQLPNPLDVFDIEQQRLRIGQPLLERIESSDLCGRNHDQNVALDAGASIGLKLRILPLRCVYQ